MLDNNLSLIFGPYGSGKTYYAVRNAYKSYLEGAVVISNMWLAFPHIRFYTNDQLVPILKEIDHYHKDKITPFYAPDSFLLAHGIERTDEEPRPFHILIDEGLVFFESREFATNFKDKSLKNMLATPRHYNMQITVITQKITRIDKAIRDMSQEFIEFTPFIFGIFRRATSYDTERFFSDGEAISENTPIVETKTYFDYLHKKRDQSKHFGGLYFTMEVLGDLAIHHVSHIRSLRQYLASESTLTDWRESYLAKLQRSLSPSPLQTSSREMSESE